MAAVPDPVTATYVGTAPGEITEAVATTLVDANVGAVGVEIPLANGATNTITAAVTVCEAAVNPLTAAFIHKLLNVPARGARQQRAGFVVVGTMLGVAGDKLALLFITV